MGYKDFMSKTDDVVWLAYQLKNKLDSKISINKIGLYKDVLEGRYLLDGYNRGIDFNVLYSDKEFLRIGVGESYAWAKYEDKLFVLNEIRTAISSIIRNGVPLGEPTVFYNVRHDKYIVPNLDYIYADKEEVIRAFQNNTIFDDGYIPEDLILFNNSNEGTKLQIKKTYCYDKKIYDREYSIIINGVYKKNSSIDTEKMRTLIIECLDSLFKLSNRRKQCELLDKYLSITGDLSCIVDAIRNCTSFAHEEELSVSVIEDGQKMQSVSYNNGIVSNYTSVSNLNGCVLNTTYEISNGIKFQTMSHFDTYRHVQELVNYEYKNINKLINSNNKNEINDNNSLTKLVRRMKNK